MIFLDNQKEQFFRMTNITYDEVYHKLLDVLINKLGFKVNPVKFNDGYPLDSVIYSGPIDHGYGKHYIFINHLKKNPTFQRYQMALCLSQYIMASDKNHLLKTNLGLGNDLERSMTLSILIPEDILLANEIVYEAITETDEEKWKRLLLGMNIGWRDLIDRKKELGHKDIPENINLEEYNPWNSKTLQ